MKVYKSRRDWIYTLMYIMISLFLLVVVVISSLDKNFDLLNWVILTLILGIVNVLILINWFLIKTKIDRDELIVNAIFDIFKVDIFKITKIRIGETMWSGFHKCGTATGGLIVFSKNKNDLYITPENQDEFLKELLKVNRHIIIEDVRK